MNKIVLVGNGFDLAHGLETRYADFMRHYLIELLTNAYSKRKLENELIKIETSKLRHINDDISVSLKKFETLKDLINSNYIKADFKNNNNIKGDTLFNLSTNSLFLRRLLQKFEDPNWVDIEQEYFNFLIELVDSKSNTKQQEIEKLNADLGIIANALKEYLKSVESSMNAQNLWNEHKSFYTEMRNLLFGKLLNDAGKDDDTAVLIVNYNYTNIIQHYLSDHPFKFDPKLLNLHGQSHDEEIIFGYGHVINTNYEKLKESGVDSALSGLKLSNYHDKNSYSAFVNFVENRNYEVIILGHSCGISDGTTLKRLFESPSCSKITVCHIGRNEHKTKRMNILRLCSADEAGDKIQQFAEEFRFPDIHEYQDIKD